jgi:magnesium-transporting ATPase (P-type)
MPEVPGSVAPAPPRPGQESQAVAMAAFAAGFIIVILAFVLLFYLYFSFCLYRIAKRLNLDEAWAAWVPILQLWPLVTAAGKPFWWILLLFIPLVNAFLIVYLWMCISEHLGKSKWLGLLMLVPIANLVLPGYLAFSQSEAG